MTPSQLKAAVEARGTESHFFTRATMKAFGDSMRNYGCRKVVIRVAYDGAGNYIGADGVEVEAWEIYRKRPVKGGNQGSAWFRCDTFARTFPQA
jgi:hypothetical protein